MAPAAARSPPRSAACKRAMQVDARLPPPMATAGSPPLAAMEGFFESPCAATLLIRLAGFHYISSAADCGNERGDGACLPRGERHGAGLVMGQ